MVVNGRPGAWYWNTTSEMPDGSVTVAVTGTSLPATGGALTVTVGPVVSPLGLICQANVVGEPAAPLWSIAVTEKVCRPFERFERWNGELHVAPLPPSTAQRKEAAAELPLKVK